MDYAREFGLVAQRKLLLEFEAHGYKVANGDLYIPCAFLSCVKRELGKEEP